VIVPYSSAISLKNDRISEHDALRQQHTAAEILARFARQPGVVLADEVGMGKTFVALAVAYSLLEAHDFNTQVVVMVPNSVRDKWPREWSVFRERCLPEASPARAADGSVSDAVSLLKLLDDPQDRRKHIIFATHSALTGQLQDSFVRLAILCRVLLRKDLRDQRAAFPRFARRLLRDARFEDRELVRRLVWKPPTVWRSICDEHLRIPLDDDPVPAAIADALNRIRFDDLAAALSALPLRESSQVDRRLTGVRRAIARELRTLWTTMLARTDLALPLLILDEAHHLKNPDTKLAQILSSWIDRDGVEQRGALCGAFRRMLFLTATPFQLGHHELVEILKRFDGIRWNEEEDPAQYQSQVARIEAALSQAQIAGFRLDQAWGRLRPEDLDGHAVGKWWETPDRSQLPDRLQRAAEEVHRTRMKMQDAERLLRPWVIRHTRPNRESRRQVFPGASILDSGSTDTRGLPVSGDAVFPFLLAARAQAIVAEDICHGGPKGQALFALGLASSFEAYRETRRRKLQEILDDQDAVEAARGSAEIDWYLAHIDRALPDDQRDLWAAHPKIRATVDRAIDLWAQGEKLVIFCFYRATGRALRRHISRTLENQLVVRGAERLGIPSYDRARILGELRRISDNRFERDAPLRRAIESLVGSTLMAAGVSRSRLGSRSGDSQEDLLDIVVRFLRTPSFLIRYFDLRKDNLAAALKAAYSTATFGGLTLEEQIARFGRFLVGRTEEEREEILAALGTVQTGGIGERVIDDDEEADRSVLLPNVRLVNGKTKPQARRTLLLAFNTPFFPEILVASSVMAEGVDLHLTCRHVIHHDLDWNPSVLEQRTGRLDRIGSKAEVVGRPVQVYEPFIEANQDEKVYRVVKDRERWFNVVMGQGMALDERATDRAATRVSLSPELATGLSMHLGL